MNAWNGYVEGVLRPMEQAKGRADAERARVVKTLRIAADAIEEQKPPDPVAWLRIEADLLESQKDEAT